LFLEGLTPSVGTVGNALNDALAKARLAERAKDGEARQRLLDEILDVVLDVAVDDEQVGGLLRGGIGMERMRAARDTSPPRLPRDHGHLAELDASISYLRQFTPPVLAAVRFDGGTDAAQLLRPRRYPCG
jgi:hypothetical protein